MKKEEVGIEERRDSNVFGEKGIKGKEVEVR